MKENKTAITCFPKLKEAELEIAHCAEKLLIDCGMISSGKTAGQRSGLQYTKIGSDGSTRIFLRIARRDKVLCVAGAPSGTSDTELAEARSVWKIGRHLYNRGIPVPRLFARDERRGIVLFEDLGDVRLHDLMGGESRIRDWQFGREWYQSVLRKLVSMQLDGSEGFDPAWCWDSPCYDAALMQARESGYFLQAFWRGFLGMQDDGGVEEEFRNIAETAAGASTDFFLHRDFQSRNIMIRDGRVRFIDFQAGRKGPLGYDVASLLIDPYAGLDTGTQEELLSYYLSVLAAHRPDLEKDFHEHYPFLALQRNLQIVGAFAFLSKVRCKPFFTAFIQPALESLQDRLADVRFAEYHTLRKLVDRSLALLPKG